MSVLILERLKRRRVPRIALNALTKRDLAAVEEIEVWDGVKSLVVEADPPVAAQADGESLGMADSASIEWNAEALKVIAGS